MPQHSFEVFPFSAYDGFNCNLWRLKNDSPATKGPVMLVHGAGVRSNIFNAPNKKNILDALAEAGYDVWLENWRGSTECVPNEWDLDIVAENDHPAAIKEICRLTRSPSVKAIVHCQGSTSFMISAIKGLVPEVNTVLSNAVSLHPVVPAFSKFKLKVMVPMVEPFTKYMNPHWGDVAPNGVAKFFRFLVKATHFENDTTVGKLVSLTYGAGTPALWELNNITDETKNWIRNEFGDVPLTFFEHIKKCIKAGALVSSDNAVNYADSPPRTTARFAFFAGQLNKCFRSESQVNTFNYFNAIKNGFHQLHLYDSYSHLDIFFGKNSYEDIFPDMIRELND